MLFLKISVIRGKKRKEELPGAVVWVSVIRAFPPTAYSAGIISNQSLQSVWPKCCTFPSIP